MELKDVLSALSGSDAFKEWRAKHANAFLAHAFVMLDEANKGSWQIGYFDEAANTMTTFVVQGASIEVIPDQEVLKADQRIAELKPADVKLPVAEALAEAQKVRMQNYPKEIPAKQFFIIQSLAEHGAVFNMTFFTMGFKTINIKLSASDGKVLHHSMQELAAFG
jgi:hypothetical protein